MSKAVRKSTPKASTEKSRHVPENVSLAVGRIREIAETLEDLDKVMAHYEDNTIQAGFAAIITDLAGDLREIAGRLSRVEPAPEKAALSTRSLFVANAATLTPSGRPSGVGFAGRATSRVTEAQPGPLGPLEGLPVSDYEKLTLISQIAGTVVLAATAVVVVVYTRETKRLREIAQRQLRAVLLPIVAIEYRGTYRSEACL